MSKNFIAPIHLVNVDLLETSFRAEPSGPSGETVTEVKLNHSFSGLQTDETGEVRFASVTLSVITELRDAQDDANVYMRGLVNLQGLLACPADPENDEHDVETWVLANGISMLYAEARSHFMNLARQSPMGDFVLPAIYVHEYLRQQEDNS